MRVNWAALLALLGLTVASPLAADPLADRILIANCAERLDSAGCCVDALAERYDGPAPALRLDAPRLQAIARALQPPSERPSWWERIKAWIRHWLESADSIPPAWLRYVPHW